MSALARGLAGRGWQVVVAAPEGAAGLDVIEAQGIEVVPLTTSRAPHPREDRAAVQRLVALARHQPIDLIHGHSSKAGALVALAGRTAGVPSVYTPHAWAFQMRNPMLIRAALAGGEAALVRLHEAIITVCADEADAARRWGVASADRVHVVHTGLEPRPEPISRTSARAELGLADEGVVVAWLGRAGRQKQPGELIALAPHLTGLATIAALGHGLADDPELAAGLSSTGVHLLPDGTSADALLSAADVFLMTSAWEGFPLAVLEAMRAGLPVVAYDVGGISEQVEDDRTGVLRPLDDRAGLSSALRQLAIDDDLRSRMGGAGADAFARRFTLERMLDGVEAIYATAGSRRAVARHS